MAEMNNKQRAALYYERLLSSSNRKLEAQEIMAEIDQLYWTHNNNPLTQAEKLALIREIEELIQGRVKPAFESVRKSRGLENFDESFSVTASNNDDLIDLIVAMKGKLK
ncbi:hypothetical protein H2Y56_11865 [Pectobacterium aroidearum]|uniref:Uncharacterized protein n=1 Tax=Pectobacterium aroidearum TaxID=1201031 RepID=A0ABR5ZE02_9GAMM|nr:MULTISPECIES: hypothetical protein [Pectobacterium]MBA5200197.1 hypothetical protein [Pectobacterium aroidearum]MBA5228443.1 hypothetical protein [Pectobacterium aroidearum]MBA5232803.1 hypothetical protein [Pectobacterium aroidearum]MBA5737967.1 hypothetical protein [Pectobacterium aroidearum]UXK00909.1 hypothetical protein N5056_02635 [Pectobacterium aroidearum]